MLRVKEDSPKSTGSNLSKGAWVFRERKEILGVNIAEGHTSKEVKTGRCYPHKRSLRRAWGSRRKRDENTRAKKGLSSYPIE